MPRRVHTGIEVPVIFRNHINIMKDNAIKPKRFLDFKVPSIHEGSLVENCRGSLELIVDLIMMIDKKAIQIKIV